MSDDFRYVSSHPFAIETSASAMPSIQTDLRNAAFVRENVQDHPVVVPTGYYKEIGELIVLWAMQEWMLAGCLCKLLAIDRKQGRIAIGSPRVEECVKRIRQLLEVKDLTVQTDLSDLKRRLKEGEQARDLIGHGVWIVPDGTNQLCVQDTSGSWDLDQTQETVSRRLYPEGRAIGQEWFSEKRNLIMRTIQDTDTLYREIEAIA